MSCCVLSNWAILPTPVYKIKTIHNDLGSTMKTLKPKKKNKQKKHATDYLFTQTLSYLKKKQLLKSMIGNEEASIILNQRD